MRKLSFASFLALAFTSLSAASPALCRAGDADVPCAQGDGSCAGAAPVKHVHPKYTKPGYPIHTAEYAGDLHPAPLPEGSCHGDGSIRYHSPIEAWLSGDECARTYSPDYGWSRPVKRPVLNRIPVQYYKMDPDYWYGDPRAFEGAYQFPIVYQPTDTTQLGFSYARVPTWQPNPAMLPAPPWPSVYHRRECPGYVPPQLGNPYARSERGCGLGKCGHGKCGQDCSTGNCPHCGVAHGEPVPVKQHEVAPQADDLPNAPAPKELEKSASRMIPNGLSRR